MDSVYLVGHEDVVRGGNIMASAADQIARSSGTFECALEQHQHFMDNWLYRLEEIMKRPNPMPGEGEG